MWTLNKALAMSAKHRVYFTSETQGRWGAFEGEFCGLLAYPVQKST